MNASDIKTLLIEALSQVSDSPLASAGFSRSAKSAEYLRKLPDTLHKFHISLTVRPRYAHGSLAHIYPRVQLSMFEVCKVAGELVTGNHELLANDSGIMLNRPFEHLVPKSERVQWYAFVKNDFGRIVHEIAESWAKWGLPFFNDYSSPEDVVRGFESGDERPMLQANWSIFVAAAYLVIDQPSRAQDVIDSAFATPGSRKKYAVLFENLKRIRTAGMPLRSPLTR